MKDILGLRNILKIGRAIVVFVSVQVVHLLSFWQWAMKRMRYQSVDGEALDLAADRQENAQIASVTATSDRAQNPPGLCAARLLQASYVTMVRDFVVGFVSWNWSPFLEKVKLIVHRETPFLVSREGLSRTASSLSIIARA